MVCVRDNAIHDAQNLFVHPAAVYSQLNAVEYKRNERFPLQMIFIQNHRERW